MEDDPRVTLTVQSLLDERHTLTQISLSQPLGAGQWIGNFRSPRRGQGTEFDDLRHYTAGDDLRHIDWKASARTNALHTRLYREEKEYRVTIVVDIRRSMFCGSEQLRAVHACRLAARMLWQSVDKGCRASVIALTDEGLYATEPSAGHKAAIQGCGLLARRFLQVQQGLQSRAHSVDSNNTPGNQATRAAAIDDQTVSDLLIELPCPGSNQIKPVLELDSALNWLLHQSHKAHSLLWVSGMDDCGEHFDSSLENLSRLTTQAAIYISDPMLETGLPSGRYGYLSRGSASLQSVVTLSHQASSTLQGALQEAEQRLKQRFESLHIPFLSTRDDDSQIINSLRHHGYLP